MLLRLTSLLQKGFFQASDNAAAIPALFLGAALSVLCTAFILRVFLLRALLLTDAIADHAIGGLRQA